MNSGSSSCSASATAMALLSPHALAFTGGFLKCPSLPPPPRASCRNPMPLCMRKDSILSLFPLLQPMKPFLASDARKWDSNSWKQMSTVTGFNQPADADENPYEVLGVSPLERFEVIKGAYTKKHKDAERRNDEILLAQLEKAYDKIMMSQLSKRKRGLTFGSLKVSKEIRYADEQSFFPWGPRFTRPSQRDVLINFAISAFFGIWMAFTGSADWKPLQFLIFSYMFRIFNKLKQFEPPEAATAVEDEDHNRRMKGGKRLLRTFGLVFSCVAISSLAFTGTLNLYEFLGMYIPLVLINSQELFVTLLSTVLLFIMGTYYR